MGTSLPTDSKVAIIVVTLSSLLSLLCTSFILLRPVIIKLLLRRRQSERDTKEDHWQTTHRMIPSPDPSKLTRPSGETMLTWPLAAVFDKSASHDDHSVRPLTTIQAALDHISQQIFLVVIIVSVLTSSTSEGLNVFQNKVTTFACAFILSLRLFTPLATTIFAAGTKFKQQSHHANRIVPALTALLVALVAATVVLLVAAFDKQSSASVVLLAISGLSVTLNTFIYLRLLVIQRRSLTVGSNGKARCASSDVGGKVDPYLPSTMSTAGTKASSANPYDSYRSSSRTLQKTAIVEPSIPMQDYESREQLSSLEASNAHQTSESPPTHLKSYFSPTTVASEGEDGDKSSLLLDQSLPFPSSSNTIPHTYDVNVDQELLMTPPHSASLDIHSPIKPLEGIGGGRLRVYSSARNLMVSVSASSSHDEQQDAPLIPLHQILIGLAGVWLVSILCIPLLLATVIVTQPAPSSFAFTLCFILAMSVTGPLIALQVLLGDKRPSWLSSTTREVTTEGGGLPRPSFASSLWTSRPSKLSSTSDIIAFQDLPPVAGDGFEPVNGYDYPFSPQFPGSYHSSDRVKSIAYASHHWNSGGVVGDRVTGSPGMISRAANMMSPKPKLQVLTHHRSKSGSEYLPSVHLGTHFRTKDEGDLSMGSKSVMELQDISQTSAVVPGAMPYSPSQEQGRPSMTLLSRRRIDTIYEVDSSRGPSVSDGRSLCAGGDVLHSSQWEAEVQQLRRPQSPFQRLANTLRKRRATVSAVETTPDRYDWVDVSPLSQERREKQQELISRPVEKKGVEVSGVSTSHNVNSHRSAVSLSFVQTPGESLQVNSMMSIPDGSFSDPETADSLSDSFVSLPGESMSNATASQSQLLLPEAQESTAEQEQKSDGQVLQCQGGDQAPSQFDSPAQAEQQDRSQEFCGGLKDESDHHNWSVLEVSPDVTSLSAPSESQDVSVVSTRSLAEVMGISDIDEEGVELLNDRNMQRSTPLRAKTNVGCSGSKSTGHTRKSLCSEMGFRAPPSQDSPCRSSSDLSSLHNRRMTMDSNCESFLSSGVDDELIMSPDATLDRITRIEEEIEREIIVIEMDEEVSQSMQRTVGEQDSDMSNEILVGEQSPSADATTTGFTYTTFRYERDGGNWLDPVEEVTEEPTLPLSVDENVGNRLPGNMEVNDAVEAEWPTGFEVQPINGPSRSHVAEEWARLHGFATPSSLAASSPASHSRFGWAEVIEANKRSSELSLHRRSPRTTLGSPASSRSLLETSLSAHTRAYLATRLATTPSRMIGLNSNFWANSPPTLALDIQNLLRSQARRRSGGGVSGSLMLAMSPRKEEQDDSGWVDGALNLEEEDAAQRETEMNEKKWKRKSKSVQRVSLTENITDSGSPTMTNKKIRGSSSKRKSSASLQSLFDTAVKRGSGALRMQQQARSSSSNGSLYSDTATKADVEDRRVSVGNESDVKVGNSPPPMTPPRKTNISIEASARAPMKSGGSISHRSAGTTRGYGQGGSLLDSPSLGKGERKRSPVRPRIQHKAHTRKESRVREKVKMLENAVRIAMVQQQEQHAEDERGGGVGSLQQSSPKKKVQTRIAVPGSPGKFRLEEAAHESSTSKPIQSPIDTSTEGSSTLKQAKRGNRASRLLSRAGSRRAYPQIFVRPPSGDSTHTQLLH